MYIITPSCGFEHMPASSQSAVTGGLQSISRPHICTDAGLLICICSHNNNNNCVGPAGCRHMHLFLLFLSLSSPFLSHSTSTTGVLCVCACLSLFFLTPLFPLSPSFCSVCFYSSVMGLVASQDYMFLTLSWQVVFKVGPI